MNYWRMAFRWGSRGYEMWPDCRERGIAAIGYYTDDGEPIVEDCTKLTEKEFVSIWDAKNPKNTTGQSSVRHVAYDMRIGDVIYVKQGPDIVGRGKVTSQYKYDPGIMAGAEYEFEHFVEVAWEAGFRPVRVLLGAERNTVLRLTPERLQMLQTAMDAELVAAKDIKSQQVEETFPEAGDKKLRYTSYYERNPKLREAAIRHHGTRCGICGFDFEQVYGPRGAGYIEVHHLYPINGLTKETKVDPRTGMIAVCSNCHRMIHRRHDEVLSPAEVKMLIQKAKETKDP